MTHILAHDNGHGAEGLLSDTRIGWLRAVGRRERHGRAGAQHDTKTAANPRPTVCLDVTSLAANTYGCDSGRIGPTRCAVIDAARGDKWRTHQASRTSRAAIRSARNVLVGGSRLVSPAAPGGFL